MGKLWNDYKMDEMPALPKRRVTKSLVTEIREMAKRGRPKKPNALSASEKQRAYRERKKAR